MRAWTAALLASLVACGGQSAQPPPPPPPTGCAAGELELDDGSCQPAGMAPGQCAEGFVHDGDRGCEPVLPDQPCTDGMIAVPGDTACRELQTCGSGSYGDIPNESNRQHVDASYQVGDSDGSASRIAVAMVSRPLTRGG